MSLRRGRLWPRLAAALLCALLAVLFVVLGGWQLQRMGWKHALVQRVEARVQATPQPPIAQADWPRLASSPLDHEYRRLRLRGEFLQQHETLVQASTVLGAGFWVLTPLRLADGTLVLVNRGFVPPERRDPARREAPAPVGVAEVTGLLRLPEPGGGFLRSNDPANGRWYSRDVPAIAAAAGLPADRIAPYFVDAEGGQMAGGWPVGGLTVLRFTDNHLVYAITWFALALMALGGGWLVLRHRR